MEEPVLQTKLDIPIPRTIPAARSRISPIPRPHLVERLNEGLPGRLTLICAPAGFGKTTLVSNWLQQAYLPSAWLSLEEEDNDFARFWTYFITTLQTIRPAVGQDTLALLQSSPQPRGHTLLNLLINDLRTIPEPFMLVLDDYHTIETDTIDQALAYLIDHLPSRMHLVIISRMDPNISFARLRANGQLNELRSADLRFTTTETAQFMEQMTGLSFTEEEMAALDRRTEGWIAGLQMAALSLRKREAVDVAQFIEEFSGSHRYIMDYLVDEVLQQQPAEVQTFLLYTSILDQLCSSLCDTLLKEEGGRRKDERDTFILPPSTDILDQLEHANLFIQPLDDQRQWYRYHPLFADLLRHRLQQTEPDRVSTLHQNASQWYEQAGLIGQAVQHALAAQAFDRAAMLVEQVAPEMIQRSELNRLLTWIDSLPEDEIQCRPLLALHECWGLFLSGQISQAAAHLDAIEALLATGKAKQTPEIQGHINAIRAYLERETGDFASTIALSQRALTDLPEQDTLLRAMVSINLVIAHYLGGDFEPASRLLDKSIADIQSAHLLANVMSAIYLKAQILRAEGSLQQALEVCQEGLDLISRRSWQHFPAAGFLYVAFGELLRERNELSTAAEYLEKGIQLGQEGAHPHILVIGYVWLAWLRQSQGEIAASQEAIHSALQAMQNHQVSRYWPLPPPSCYQARLWIAQGNLPAANLWAQTEGLDPVKPPATYMYEVEYLTLARLLIAQSNLETAGELLLRLKQAAASAERNGSLIEILVLQAMTFYAQKHSEEALSALAQAMGLAEREGFVRIFMDEGVPMAELLRQAVAKDVHAPYALHLLDAIGNTSSTSQSLIDPLSERELEVLRRLAAGYSNQEIAQELVVAVSTVKKHINNIYSKLGVGSRTQAVARARELRYL